MAGGFFDNWTLEDFEKLLSEDSEASLTIEQSSKKAQLIRYYFDTVTDDSVSFQSQITDNWVENNSAIQDHIAISPITITMRGLIGELVYTSKEAALDAQSELAQVRLNNTFDTFGTKLKTIEAFLPEVSNYTQRAINVWNNFVESRKRAGLISDLWVAPGPTNLTAQMNAYNGIPFEAKSVKLKEVTEKLKSCWLNRQSLIATTPFGTFENMYIQSVLLHQGNENFIGEIDVTLKQLRFAQTLTTKADKEVLAKYNAYAQASEQNYGKAQGNTSVLKELSDKYLGTTPGSGIRR